MTALFSAVFKHDQDMIYFCSFLFFDLSLFVNNACLPYLCFNKNTLYLYVKMLTADKLHRQDRLYCVAVFVDSILKFLLLLTQPRPNILQLDWKFVTQPSLWNQARCTARPFAPHSALQFYTLQSPLLHCSSALYSVASARSTTQKNINRYFHKNDKCNLFARPASEHTFIGTDTHTRLALQKFINNPTLLSNIESWVQGGQFCRQVSTPSFPTRPLAKYQIARFLPNFESPIISLKVAGKLALSCVDSGASGVLCSSGYYKTLFPGLKPQKYVGLSYRQASGDLLPIEGQFEAHIEIGNLKLFTTLVVMKTADSHKELLLGWKLLKLHQISICPDGLFCFPSSIFSAEAPTCHQACITAGSPEEFQPPLLDKEGAGTPGHRLIGGGERPNACTPHFLSFPVHLVQAYTIPPLGKALILCKLKKVTQLSINQLQGKFMCFSSENIEKYTPILDISVYHQIVPYTELFHTVTLLYRNHTKQTQFLFEDQHVADCIEMQQASSADLLQVHATQLDVYIACRILNQNEPSLQSPPHSLFEFQIEENPTPVTFSNVKTHDATLSQRQKLITLLQKFPALFSSHTWSVGEFDSTVYLRAKTGAEPQQQRFIPHPKKLEKQCQTIIRKLLDLGLVVENPDSPWRSNILFLLKPEKKGTFDDQINDKIPPTKDPKIGPDKDPQRQQGFLPDRGFGPLPQNLKNRDDEIPLSRIRIVMDMTMINSHLKRTWPSCVLPKIEDIFNNCYGMKFLSRYDLTQSFWSKKVNKSMMDLSTFYFMGKAYSMARMVQGCSASSEIFQTSINKVIQKNKLSLEQNITFCGKTSCTSTTKPCSQQSCGKPAYGCFAFIDDIFLVSRTEEDHYIIIEKSLSAFHEAHLKIKLEKTDLFITSSCDVLGFHLDLANSCISPAQKNLQKVVSLPAPTTFKKLQKWLGAINFYCHLLPDFSNILTPLTDLLKTNSPWHWGPQQQQAYDQVLRKMASQPTLFILNPDAPIYAVTDGCLKKSISYCQLQWRQDLDTWCPIRFQSHKLSAHMINYSQAQIEALALCNYASENYPLLMSHTSHCFSDAKSLSFLSRFRYHNLTIWRYHLLLSSLPLVFHWLSSQAPLLILCDLFTREQEYQLNPLDKFKEVLNKRLSPLDIENLQCIDFSHMPSMTYTQVLSILDAFHKILEKNTPQEVSDKLKTHMAQVPFPNVPDMTFNFKKQVFNIYSDLFNNSIGELDFCHHYPRIPTPQNVGFLSESQDPQIPMSQDFTNLPQHKKGPFQKKTPVDLRIAAASEKLQIFFPAYSQENLITEQQKDAALLKLLQNHPKVFLKIDGVICHKKVLHSVPIITICWPVHLNVTLLDKAHKINSFYHIRKTKLKGELFQLFHIRSFDKSYKKMSCKHCDLNVRHNRLSLPLGVPFLITQPRTFLALDIMYINTDWTNCAFLTICDVTNHFVQAVPVTKNATAQDIYHIFFTRWVCFAGYAIGICTDNARNFNCKLSADLAALCNFVHFKITPQNSKSNRAEAGQKFLLQILQAMHQSEQLQEKNFEQMLSFACLLWNSTYNTALQMSPAEHFYFSKVRTNSFVTFSSLLYHQHRYSLSQNVSRILDILNIVRLRKREHFLRQKKIWDEHKDKFVIGGFCFVQKDRVKKPGYKLRQIFKDTLYKITRVFKTYLFVIPISGTLSLIKSPYIQGDQNIAQQQRVHKSRVKHCHDPLTFLNLQHCKHFIDSAVQLLGMGKPVQSIVITSNPPSKSTLLSNRAFDVDFWDIFRQSSNLDGVTDLALQRDAAGGSNGGGEVTSCVPQPPPPICKPPGTGFCATFQPDLFLAALHDNNGFVSFQSRNSWILIDRKLKDSPVLSTHATCSYGLTQKYKDFQKKLLKKRLNPHISLSKVSTSWENQQASKPGRSRLKRSRSFLKKMDQYFITFDKSSIPKLCIDKMEKVLKEEEQASSDSEEWVPRASSLDSLSSSQSGSQFSSSTSLHSALDNNVRDDHDIAEERNRTSSPQRLVPSLQFISDEQVEDQGIMISDHASLRSSKRKLKTTQKTSQKSKMMSVEQALSSPPPSSSGQDNKNQPSPLSSSSSIQRRQLRVKTRPAAHSSN